MERNDDQRQYPSDRRIIQFLHMRNNSCLVDPVVIKMAEFLFTIKYLGTLEGQFPYYALQ